MCHILTTQFLAIRKIKISLKILQIKKNTYNFHLHDKKTIQRNGIIYRYDNYPTLRLTDRFVGQGRTANL